MQNLTEHRHYNILYYMHECVQKITYLNWGDILNFIYLLGKLNNMAKHNSLKRHFFIICFTSVVLISLHHYASKYININGAGRTSVAIKPLCTFLLVMYSKWNNQKYWYLTWEMYLNQGPSIIIPSDIICQLYIRILIAPFNVVQISVKNNTIKRTITLFENFTRLTHSTVYLIYLG